MSPAAGANGANAWDLEKAAAAAAREAGESPFVFTYKGKTYRVPSSNKWPVEALDRLAEGDLGAALSALLGEATYNGLKAAGLNLGEINTLFDKMAEAEGMSGAPDFKPPRKPATTRT